MATSKKTASAASKILAASRSGRHHDVTGSGVRPSKNKTIAGSLLSQSQKRSEDIDRAFSKAEKMTPKVGAHRAKK